MLGTVNVDNLNAYQNAINEIERRFVFIGKVAKAELQGTVTALNAGTDIDALISSSTPNSLSMIITAAQLNAGANWEAAFVGLPDTGLTWQEALDLANKTNHYEAVVVCDPITEKDDLQAAASKMASVQSKSARYMFAMLCSSGIDPTASSGQTWPEYITAQGALVKDFVSERVMCIPLLFQNDLGILAGRLCNRTVTIADSPMRTKTGVLLGMGQASADKDNIPMPDTLFTSLDALQYSVPQTYAGEDGFYWADGNVFDTDTGDYKVIENLRVVLKACRRVYKVAIPTIADRALNSSPNSVNTNKQLYAKPLREMAAPVRINAVPFPGEIYPPEDDAIDINWISWTQTKIYITVRPYNSQKTISIGVGLDLSLQNAS